MPVLTSQKHQWTSQPPYNFYHFPDEHYPCWATFWQEMDGDIEKILKFAKEADIECPKEWFESLHRFLFSTFSGNPILCTAASKKTFGEFLKQVADNHKNDPKDRAWYVIRGITPDGFVVAIANASEIKDVRQAVAHVNARIKDLGFYLYSEYILSKTKQAKEIKSVASENNKKAFELEASALNQSPLSNLANGDIVFHYLFPDDKFMVIDIEKEASKINMVTVKDLYGKISFVNDIWNLGTE
jgi:hypothetical protein